MIEAAVIFAPRDLLRLVSHPRLSPPAPPSLHHSLSLSLSLPGRVPWTKVRVMGSKLASAPLAPAVSENFTARTSRNARAERARADTFSERGTFIGGIGGSGMESSARNVLNRNVSGAVPKRTSGRRSPLFRPAGHVSEEDGPRCRQRAARPNLAAL